MQYFITSKYGQIKEIKTYSYKFSNSLLNNSNESVLPKFKNWLVKNLSNHVVSINNEGFGLHNQLEDGWQYHLINEKSLQTPFENTQAVSSYIGEIIRANFNEKFEQYLNRNIFTVKTISLEYVELHKCISFNIEVFEEGDFFVHFLPTTQITSPKSIDIGYINSLKNNLDSNLSDIRITLVNPENYRRKTIDLTDNEAIKIARDFIEKNENVICTFNYNTLSNISTDDYGKVTEETIKDLDTSIYFLQDVISKTQFDERFNFQEKCFFKIQQSHLDEKPNLSIGQNKIVRKASAAYYNGIFQPVNNKTLIPLVIDGKGHQDKILELFHIFNKEGDLKINESITIDSKEDNMYHPLFNVLPNKTNNVLIVIFCNVIPYNNFTDPLKKKNLKYQIYTGAFDTYKASNFAVKCLEKLGGKLSIIHDLGENDQTFFVGIDLGHSTKAKKRFSKLAISCFNNHGVHVFSRTTDTIVLDEALNYDAIHQLLIEFRAALKRKKLPEVKRLIFHRDGKLHYGDVESLCKATNTVFSTKDIEVLEIIKQGHPVMAFFDTGAYVNPQSGDAYIYKNYSILVTNTQSTDKNATVRPIIIKHKYGNGEIYKLVRQVYYFTNVYTNNLYNSTRLPATTLRANNIVGTSLKQHRASYLG